ncbi:MAG: glycosyltransferase [Actinomycetota bacterium]|nr:glycosyltransferase [Actinomycetota bacterium]
MSEQLVADDLHGDLAYCPLEHDTVVVHSCPLWSEQLEREVGSRSLVAYTTWETDRVPPEWVEILNRYDRVLVPSSFNAAIFRACDVTLPISVVPHIARLPRVTEAPRRVDDRFTFYVIATWTTRKAILDVVSAYLQAFTAGDPVVLVIHTTDEDVIARGRFDRSGLVQPAHGASWFSLARALGGRRSVPEIRLSTRSLSLEGIDALHAACDCFVLLSHGEGWGLGAFEAAAAGNPVIVTGWGGTLEFLPSGYPYLVEYDLVPTIDAEQDAWWRPRPGERWAQARISHAAQLMREAFERRAEALQWGATLKAHVSAEFSEARVTRELLEALNQGAGEEPTAARSADALSSRTD